jgi:drug/metabolite transporter (DMT)-like permease
VIAAHKRTPLTEGVLRVAPVIFLLLWSGGYTAVRIAIRHTGALSLLALRYLLVVALLAIAVAVVRPAFPRGWRAYGQLALIGVLVQVGYFGFTNLALAAGVSVAVTALVGSLQPIVVAILAPWAVGERSGLRQWLGLVLGLAGAAIVILARSSFALTAAGLGAAIGALLAISAGTLVERRFGADHHPLASNLVQYTVGVAVTVPLAFVFDGSIRLSSSLEMWEALAYLVIGNSLISITLLLAMVRAGQATRVSALFFLVPPLSAFYALIVLGESLPPISWVGMALAAIGVALVTLAARKPAPAL